MHTSWLAGWLTGWLAAGKLARRWLAGCWPVAAAGWLLARWWLAGWLPAVSLLARWLLDDCWLAAGWLLAHWLAAGFWLAGCWLAGWLLARTWIHIIIYLTICGSRNLSLRGKDFPQQETAYTCIHACIMKNLCSIITIDGITEVQETCRDMTNPDMFKNTRKKHDYECSDAQEGIKRTMPKTQLGKQQKCNNDRGPDPAKIGFRHLDF